jgi:hypothetical protein
VCSQLLPRGRGMLCLEGSWEVVCGTLVCVVCLCVVMLLLHACEVNLCSIKDHRVLCSAWLLLWAVSL